MNNIPFLKNNMYLCTWNGEVEAYMGMAESNEP